MKKILFFPLLRMPSGHHQVADTIRSYITNRDSSIICKKIDLLSAWNPFIETLVTKTYLEWIHHFPKMYAWVYTHLAHSKTGRSFKYYEILFLSKMRTILQEEKPDLIICTHGFPSYFLNQLKFRGQCNIPVINVYTDFFINDIWGRERIDYHFVPSQMVKDELIHNSAISEDRVIITGIPIAEQFLKHNNEISKKESTYKVLISGGSVGLGNIAEILEKQGQSKIEFFVLCGKNEQLFQKLSKSSSENIHPLPYINSKEKMNQLYDYVDAIITKPGGVTISEALQKELPIFIHSALPGQEEINLRLLEKLGLVHMLKDDIPFELQIENVLYSNNRRREELLNNVQLYLEETAAGKPSEIYLFIKKIINSNDFGYISTHSNIL